MFSKPLDPILKAKLYEDLRADPETNVLRLRTMLERELELKNFDKIKEVLRVFKFMIKDKTPAKPKFYALVLIKELMESQKPQIADFFMKKLMSRLFQLTNFEPKNPDIRRGERCLKKYYSKDSKENSEFSLRFFMLLLECWKHWAKLYGGTYKKIKEKCDKLKPLFPANDIYYDYLDKSSNQQPDIGDRSPGLNGQRMSHNPGQGHYLLDDSIQSKPRESLESTEKNKQISSKSKSLPPVKSIVKVDLKELNPSYEVRQYLKEFLEASNEELFYESYNDFYKTIQNELTILNKAKPAMMKNPAYDENSRAKFNSEIAALTALIENLDKFGRADLTFNDLGKQILDIERKYPITISGSNKEKVNISFNQSFKITNDEEKHVERYNGFGKEEHFEEVKLGHKKGGQSAVNTKSDLPSNSRVKPFQTNFGVIEESNEDDSNAGKLSNGMGNSSRMITESADDKPRSFINSVDHQIENNYHKQSGKEKQAFEDNAEGWNFNFESVGNTNEVSEANGFGDFDGFGKSETPGFMSQKDSGKSQAKTSGMTMNLPPKTKANNFPSKQTSKTKSEEGKVKTSVKPQAKKLQIDTDFNSGDPHVPTNAKTNLRTNTIVEEDLDDGEGTRRNTRKTANPLKPASLKKFPDNNRSNGSPLEIRFDDFIYPHDGSNEQFSSEKQPPHSQAHSNVKISSKKTFGEIPTKSKPLPNAKGTSGDPKNKFNMAFTNTETSPKDKSHSANANPHQNRQNTKNAKNIKPDAFAKTFDQFDGSASLPDDKDPFFTANFNFKMEDFGGNDESRPEFQSDNGFDNFASDDAQPKLTFAHGGRHSNNTARSTSRNDVNNQNFDTDGNDPSYMNYNFEFRDSALSELRNGETSIRVSERKSSLKKARAPQNSEILTQNHKDLKMQEDSKRPGQSSPNRVESLKMMKDPFGRQLSFKSPNPDDGLNPQNFMFGNSVPHTEESIDHFEDAIDKESDHFEYNLQEQFNSPAVKPNVENFHPKISSKFFRAKEHISPNLSADLHMITQSQEVESFDRQPEYKKYAMGQNLQAHFESKAQTQGLAGQQIMEQTIRIDTNPNNALSNYTEKLTFPSDQQSPFTSETLPNILKAATAVRPERVDKASKETQDQQSLVSLITTRNPEFNHLVPSTNDPSDISELKMNNEFLKQQCELLFNQLMDKQKETVTANVTNLRPMAATSQNFNLMEVQDKITQRKNNLFSHQSQAMSHSKANNMTTSKGRRRRNEEETALYGQLAAELKLYAIELSKELGKFIRG